MTEKPKKNNGKLISSLALVLAAMGACLYFMKAQMNPLMAGWTIFCVSIVCVYFLVIWLKNKFKT